MTRTGDQIDLATEADFTLGGLSVRPSLLEAAADSETIALEPRVMQVLVHLARRRGEAVTRDELMASCWGGVVVGEDAIQRCIAKLRRLAAATGGFEIATLSRVGYRLLETQGVAPSTPSAAGPAAVTTPGRSHRLGLEIFAFRNVTGSDADQTLADMITDDAVTALALNQDLSVITSRVEADRADGARRTARYSLHGGLRRLGDQIQVSLRLTDARDGAVVLGHRFDRPAAGFEAGLDDLVMELCGRVAAEVMRIETDQALRKSSDLTAWEAVVRSISAYQRISVDNIAFAISEARRALKIDPDYPQAHAALANALAGLFEVTGGREPDLARESAAACERALELDPDHPDVLARAATALAMLGRPEEGLPYAERAVQLDPYRPIAHLYLGRVLLRLTRPDDALRCFETYERLSPRLPLLYFSSFNRSLAHFMAGRVAEAEAAQLQSLVLNPNYSFAWLARALLLGLQGRDEEACEAARRLQRLDGVASLPLQIARIEYGYPDKSVAGMLTDLMATIWTRALEA